MYYRQKFTICVSNIKKIIAQQKTIESKTQDYRARLLRQAGRLQLLPPEADRHKTGRIAYVSL